MSIEAVKMVGIDALADFKAGPFSDNKEFSNAARRRILTSVLTELMKFPNENAEQIVFINAKLKGLN